eukprot:1184814-Alexandrium_andersonii.AAC.1
MHICFVLCTESFTFPETVCKHRHDGTKLESRTRSTAREVLPSEQPLLAQVRPVSGRFGKFGRSAALAVPSVSSSAIPRDACNLQNALQAAPRLHD